MIQRHFAEILLTFLINICVYIVSIKGVILLKQFSCFFHQMSGNKSQIAPRGLWTNCWHHDTAI